MKNSVVELLGNVLGTFIFLPTPFIYALISQEIKASFLMFTQQNT